MKSVINGTEVNVIEGESILKAAERNGVSIPKLCSYPGFENGVCRLCMVEVEGNPKMVPACSTNVSDGMKITTVSERLEDYRKTLIELYMKDHPAHPQKQDMKCSLHQYADDYGIRSTTKQKTDRIDDSHPAFVFNPDLCIDCRRCLIACDMDQNNDVISLIGRGHNTVIGFDSNVPMGSSTCTTCGACADSCPTGAIIEKNWEPVENTVVSTCPYCAVGCQIEYGVKDNKIVWARGDKELGINQGKLCVKGKFGFEFENSNERLLKPLIRRVGIPHGPLNGRSVKEVFREASWNEALDFLAGHIKSTRENYGKDSIGGVASDRSTNEDVYAFQKFMRAALKTDNLDQSATLCHSPSAVMLSWSLGAGASTNPINDIPNANTIFVVGSNTDMSHPVLSSYIKRAKKNGAYLIVVDPRNVELARRADLFLQIKPGTDVVLFSAIARYIIDNNMVDRKYVQNHAEGYTKFADSLDRFSLMYAEQVTGIPVDKIEKAARRYALGKPSSIFWTLGITEHVNGSDNVSSLVNLAILTGNLGVRGGGVNPIRGQNNVQGGADVGGFPGSLPGYQKLEDPEVRDKFEKLWKTDIPAKTGLKSTEMIQEVLNGNIRLMYLSGENSIRSHPNSNEVDEALRKLDFLAVQDIFLNETAEYADLILPAASTFEKLGTFTNTERRVQLVRPVIKPPGQARPDWEIYSDLSSRLGYDLGFKSSGDIMEEMSIAAPTWKGISHERLEEAGLQWPVPSVKSRGTEILHENGVMRGKARLRPLEWNDKPEDGFPYVIITGRERGHYHTATMTSRSSVIRSVTKGPAIEMNRKDMALENIEEGETVEVESSVGKLKAKVRSDDNLPPGVIFTTFHYPELRANLLTPSVLDPITKTPAYKDTRVKIHKLT